jgi:CubicO group peptidase (beta-lactamase class C family)
MGSPPVVNEANGWLDDITLRNLATHAAGFDKAGGFVELEHEPETQWDYSDGGANWLADVLTLTFDDDLDDVLRTRVLTPLGIDASDVVWRDNLYRSDLLDGHKRREFGAGISTSADVLARLGLLMLRQGTWDGNPILPSAFVLEVGQSDPTLAALGNAEPGEYPGATSHYGILWWNNADGTIAGVPRDTYWSWGLGECLIVVMPSLNIVAARVGNGWQSGWSGDYSVLAPFLEPIAAAAGFTPVSAGESVSTETWGGIKSFYRVP